MHTVRYNELSWDSRFFGFPVGMINAIELSQNDLQSQLADIIQSPPCRLLYIHIDPEDALAQTYVTQLGAQVVDNRVVYRKKINTTHTANASEISIPAEAFVGCESTELNELAFLAGRYSRFRTDSNLNETDFQRLYTQWIKRSVTGDIADKVLITRDHENLPASLITLSCKEKIGSIGLIAVRADQQGNGLGLLLVSQALRYFSHKLCTTAEVVTQGTNTAACKLYEKTGFICVCSSNTYHLWLPFLSTQNKR